MLLTINPFGSGASGSVWVQTSRSVHQGRRISVREQSGRKTTGTASSSLPSWRYKSSRAMHPVLFSILQNTKLD